MKRRDLLRSAVVVPMAASARAQISGGRPAGERVDAVPNGPALVPPGFGETPTIPVVTAAETSDGQVVTFTAEQFSCLQRLAEILVPAFEGFPGAQEARAAEFLDFLVGCSPDGRLELYRHGLEELDRQSERQYTKPFSKTTASEANALLAPLKEQWKYRDAEQQDFRAFLLAARRDVLRATFNSKPYIDAVSEVRRPRNASGFYWKRVE